MDRIIALIDGSAYAESVCDHAAWVSEATGFGVDLLHVVDRRDGAPAPVNLAGNLTLGARSELLEKLTAHDEQSARLARERGRLVLDAAEAHLRTRIEDVRHRLRLGDLLEAVQETEDEARLLIIGKRGESADFAKLHLGSNLERVVRAAQRPVLVASRAFKPVKRVLLAFDEGESVAKAVAHMAKGKLFDGMEIRLVHAGEDRPSMRAAMEAAAQTLDAAGRKSQIAIEPGEPDAVITRMVQDEAMDLLVMGAYGHSRVRSLIIGSTTTQMVRGCPIPVLLFR
jgi:nucleotide-binding universal stress UspA family protein